MFVAHEMPWERFVLPPDRRCDVLELTITTRRCEHEAILRVSGMKLCGHCYLNLLRLIMEERRW